MLLPREKWKDIKKYEGKYQVSNLGNVRSLNYHRENKIYNSTREASEDINCCQSFISLVCSGKRENAKGYHFSYIEGDEN